MNKFAILLGVVCCFSVVLAGNYIETGRPVIQLASIGGFVPGISIANQIPEIKLWVDGTIIFTEYDTDGKRKVSFAQVSTEEISHLTDKVDAAGFLNFNEHYIADNAPTDMPDTCIKFWTSETESKQVCEYFGGAPDFFHYLMTHLRALRDTVKSDAAKPFYPVAGFVRSFNEHCSGGACKSVEAYKGPKLNSAGSWITDTEALVKLWDAVNSNKILTDGPNCFFRVSVQVEDLSIVEPPITKPIPIPNTESTSVTLIVRCFALGFSGLLFIFGLALLIRLVQRRRMQQKQKDEEMAMIETSAQPSTQPVYEPAQNPQFVSTQQWGSPAYVNTTPQYMVYYMQPTQTVQQ